MMRRFIFLTVSVVMIAACGDGSIHGHDMDHSLFATESTGTDPVLPSDGDTTTSPDIDVQLPPGSLVAMQPRHEGFFDAANADAATIAVSHSGIVADVSTVTFDFELFTDSALSIAAGSGTDIPMATTTSWTTWETPSLTIDTKYFWRVRAVISGAEEGWSGPFSFTVRNLCDADMEGSAYAVAAISLSAPRQCDELALTDPEAALGNPDASGDGFNEPYENFVSLDYGGTLDIEMGATIIDGPGTDIRIFEYFSTEVMEIYAGRSETGPWVSLGILWCEEYCEIDLGLAGVPYARYFRIRDIWSLAGACHATAGLDIDAVEALNVARGVDSCPALP